MRSVLASLVLGASGVSSLAAQHADRRAELAGCSSAPLNATAVAPATDEHEPTAPGARCPVVGIADSASPGGRTARTLSEALAGRVPGVSVLRSSGVTGTGARVRMRGGSGLVVPRTPLLFIDGVRVDESQTSLGIDVGGQSPSRLDDVPLDHVERIETLRGPAAAALYGTDAAGGVILVTTRHGARGKLKWSSHVDGGATMDATAYPANFATQPDATGGACPRAWAAVRICTPGALIQWNPLERASSFQSGVRLGGSATASGGVALTNYFATVSASRDRGPLAPNDDRRWAGRLNLDARPFSSFRIALGGSHIVSRTTFPLGDNYGVSILRAGLAGNAVDDPRYRGYRGNPTTLALVATQQHIERTMGTVAPVWTPARWLTVNGLVGREVMRRNDSQTYPMAAAFDNPETDGPYRYQGSTGRDMRTTIGGSVAAAYPLASRIDATTRLGAERLTTSLRSRDSLFLFFSDGAPGGNARSRGAAVRKNVGTFATQTITWGGRAVTAGVRRDDGREGTVLEVKPTTYWSASAAWDVTAERFFRSTPVARSLALRASYGVGGDSRPLNTVLNSVVIVPPTSGDPTPPLQPFAPEKVSELEIGAAISTDIGTQSGRLGFDVAWYRQRSKNSYERGCCVQTLPYDSRGGWHTNGLELAIDATVFETVSSKWTAHVTLASMSNTFDRSSTDFARAHDFTGFGNGGGANRRLSVLGHPIAGLWGYPTTGRDANGDGVIDATEITRAQDSVYLGSSIPTREAGLATSLTMFRRLTLSAQLDYHGGFRKMNATELYRCQGLDCAALFVPDASLDDQTRAIDGQRGPLFNERGDFIRLREVALAWVLAPGWAYRNGFDRIAVTVAGRNLLTGTKYSGLDPEVNALGQSTFGTTEFLTLPLPRTVLIRVDVEH